MILRGKFLEGYFIHRPNRFLTLVNIDGREEYAHLPNPGRLQELLLPGVPVILKESLNKDRKTKYTLIMTRKNGELISLNTTLPNSLAAEAIMDNKIREFKDYQIIRREVKYKESRFDLLLSKKETLCFLEIKSVTMMKGDVAMFPDAPTLRGVKHIHHLMEAMDEGYEAAILFIIQRHGAKLFTTNNDTDPKFAMALQQAQKYGVKLYAYTCKINPRNVEIDYKVDISL